jgi:hypothetical protein
MYLFSEFSLLPFVVLLALWTLGGTLILSRLFDLPAEERVLLGLALGMVISTWLANLLAQVLPVPVGFWGAAVLTLALGVALAWPLRRDLFSRAMFQRAQWLVFLLIFFAFTLFGRGLGIFDDYQNLPPVSTLAAGDIPPHFAFDPDLRWGYHYFLLLVAAQFLRLADAGPWTALDLARGLAFGLTLMSAGFLAYRFTKSRLAQTFSMIFLAFAGGARWIFYLLPASWMNRLSSSVTLIGSGADTGVNLNVALYKNWDIQGLGPMPFPFIFGSGLDASLSTLHNGFSTSAILIVLLMLLLADFRCSRWSFLPLVLLLGSLAMANEVTFVFLYAAFGLAALVWILQHRTLKLPASFWYWVGIFFAAGLLSLFEGGIITETVRGKIQEWTTGQTGTYFQVTFALGAPQVLSAHLGELSLLSPLQWIAILAETGLAVFILPLVLRSTLPGLRDEKWLQTAWILTIFVSLAAVFLRYTGNAGPTALSRLQAHFLLVIKLYAVPVLWLWLKNRSENWHVGALAWGAATIFSGLALLGPQLAAMPNPQYGEFLNHLDDRMFQKHWNTLKPGALVFDPTHPRAVTVFGRFTRASINYGPPTAEWSALAKNPVPQNLLAAGFEYVYYDAKYGKKYEAILLQPCVEKLDYTEETTPGGDLSDSRTLLWIGKCLP